MNEVNTISSVNHVAVTPYVTKCSELEKIAANSTTRSNCLYVHVPTFQIGHCKDRWAHNPLLYLDKPVLNPYAKEFYPKLMMCEKLQNCKKKYSLNPDAKPFASNLVNCINMDSEQNTSLQNSLLDISLAEQNISNPGILDLSENDIATPRISNGNSLLVALSENLRENWPLDTSPIVYELSTPSLSEISNISDIISNDHESSTTSTSPSVHNLSTPILSETSHISHASEVQLHQHKMNKISVGGSGTISNLYGELYGATLLFCLMLSVCIIICINNALGIIPAKIGLNQSVCKDNGDSVLNNKYVSKDFIDKRDVDCQEVSKVLRQLRVKNANRVIIGHLNVNFFAAKLDAIKTIIPGNIDIMIFSETKLDNSYPMAQLLIDGFRKPFRLDRNSRGGGLLIYVRTDIPCKQVVTYELPDKIEGIFVEINFRKSKWLLYGTYHPPSQNDNFYFQSIGRALDIYTQTYDKILLAGDFNAKEQDVILKNFMELYNLKNLVKENTCFKSVINPSCIDLFLTNCCASFQNTAAISTGISDCHKMIVTVLKTTFKKAKPKEVTYRCYKQFDKCVFKKDLKHNLTNCTNYEDFESRFLEILNMHAPLKKRIVRANEVPYMTRALRKSIATRSRLENKYYKNKSCESLRAYRKQKNFCSRLYKKERKKYYRELDVKNVTDNKKFWKTAKPFFSDKGTGKTDIILIEDNNIFQEDSEVAKILDDFFSNAVKSLNIDIPSEFINEKYTVSEDEIENILSKYSNHPSIKLISENVIKGNFSFIAVSQSDVEKEVRALDAKKASMSSSIPPQFLKENIDVCSKPLTNIINNGISNSYFDNGLKRADLTPIHKTDDSTNKKNYRNISLLPVVSKIFEKAMQAQISDYMKIFLSPYLCGYRKGYSAQHALLSMLEKWRLTLDKGGFAGGVLMDLSKAFDTLNHDLLIAKLHAYGFDTNALRLIKSYLTDRWQRTKINTSYSSWSELLIGVPQGSVLGPLLFNLFINDLFYIIKTDICNYADDNTPYTSDMCLDKLMEKLECATKCAMDWFQYNGMKLNSDKCHLLVCGHKFESMICKIDDTQVIETNIVKLLGIQIESKLTFKNHMETICKKASQKLNALSRLCTIMPFHRRKVLMQAFFNSQFSYCPLVWMFHGRKINTRIDNLHFRALRMIYLDETSSFEELLQKDGSVTVHHRNLQLLAIEMFKAVNNMSPDFMKEIFAEKENTFSEHVSSSTRSQSIFYNHSNPKSVNHGLQTLRSLSPKVWDMIPNNIKKSPSLADFKAKIKNWIPSKCPCKLCKIFVPQVGFL